jgi:hypothetical protein
MGGFVGVLSAAIPVVQKIVDEIKEKIDSKTKAVAPDAAKAATDKTGDKKKGPEAAEAATPVVVTAAKQGAQEVADNSSASYKKAQLDLSEQLAIVASLRPIFIAEDHVFAMRQVLAFKDENLDSDDVAMMVTWWKTASDTLKEIASQDASIIKLEESERTTIRYAAKAMDDGFVNEIDEALATLKNPDAKLAFLADRVGSLHEILSNATFAALSVLQDLSDGLKKAAA